MPLPPDESGISSVAERLDQALFDGSEMRGAEGPPTDNLPKASGSLSLRPAVFAPSAGL